MVTEFLATVMGWYLVIFSLFVLLRYQELKVITSELLVQPALFFIFALFTVIVGLLMVVSHNIWHWDWSVLVTLLSWLVLINGLFRLFWAQKAIPVGRRFFDNPLAIKSVASVLLLLGLFLLYKVCIN